jgi:hypothetical protein
MSDKNERISLEEYNRLVGEGRAPRLTNKYGNIPTEVDGYRFDSKKEAAEYQRLKYRQQAGEIRNLVADKKQLRFALVVGGVHICDYEADFTYEEKLPGPGSAPYWKRVVSDAKGFKTPEYKIKKKLMLGLMGIEIKEV